jgi:hypothetical protein
MLPPQIQSVLTFCVTVAGDDVPLTCEPEKEKVLCYITSVLSKRQMWLSIFHIINIKKKKKKFMDTRESWIYLIKN